MTYIIAEIGINHNGKISEALKLVKIAKKANADAVKLQTYDPKQLMLKKLGKAPYQKKKNKKQNIFDIISKCQLSFADHFKIKRLCKKLNIDLISSPFDISSAKFLIEKLKIYKIKIPSGEITNYPLLEYLGKKNTPLIISTGMSNIKEISEALNILKKNGHKNEKSLLHCTTSYPTPNSEVNLKAIQTLRKKFKLEIGYSDHTQGYLAATGAVSMGAHIIEKHITLDNNLEGPDHKTSLNPTNFNKFVIKIKEMQTMLGDGEKKITSSEKKNIKFARKSIIANKDISKGEKFTIKNITTKRASNGISAIKWKSILGKKAKKKYYIDEII